MKVLRSSILLIWGVFASAFGGYSFLASDGMEMVAARHEASHAILQSHTPDEAIEVLRTLDSVWFRGNQVSLVLVITGLLLVGSSVAALRRAGRQPAGSVG